MWEGHPWFWGSLHSVTARVLEALDKQKAQGSTTSRRSPKKEVGQDKGKPFRIGG